MEDADYEASRLKAKAEMDAAFAEHCKSLPFFKEFEDTKSRRSYAEEWKENMENDDVKTRSVTKPRTPRRKSNFFEPIRKSARAKKLRSNSDSFYMESSDEELLTGLDDERAGRFKGKRRRITVNLAPQYTKPPGVDEITPYMLENINYKGTAKIWCKTSAGSTCHQCRQKTLDTKTVCRSGRCLGVRGQFCGPCLLNRHGERVSDALLNPVWECPPCQGLCNCSFCMKKAGLVPTGIVFPSLGPAYSSVREYLAAEESYPLPGNEEGNSDYTDSGDSEGEEDLGVVMPLEEDLLDQIYAQMFPDKASKRHRKKRKRTSTQVEKKTRSFRGFAEPIRKPEGELFIQQITDRFSDGILPCPVRDGTCYALSDAQSDSDLEPFFGFIDEVNNMNPAPIIQQNLDQASNKILALKADRKSFQGLTQPIKKQDTELITQLLDRNSDKILGSKASSVTETESLQILTQPIKKEVEALEENLPRLLHSEPDSSTETKPFPGFKQPTADPETELTVQPLPKQPSCGNMSCSPIAGRKSPNPKPCGGSPTSDSEGELEEFKGFEHPIRNHETELIMQKLINRASDVIINGDAENTISFAFDFEEQLFRGFPDLL